MNKNNICSLPWTGFSNDPDGRVRPCCIYKEHIQDENGNAMFIQDHSVKDILHSPYMKKLRQDFREGNSIPQCSTCWIDEANNKKSKRQFYYRDWLDYEAEPDLPTEYQLIISNTCNLKCRSCSPSHSTKWIKEAIDFNFFQKPPHDVDITDEEKSVFWKDRDQWMPHIKNLDIVGGEPFFIREWGQLWDEFAAKGYSKNIALGISTNATVFNRDRVEFLIENFLHTGISLSLDGIGSQFEYMRHPGKWADAENHGNQYHEIFERETFRVQCGEFNRYRNAITHTISWPNIWYVPTFHEYCTKNWPLFNIWNNVVHGPDYLSPWVLPEEVKEKVAERLRSYKFEDKYQGDIEGIINFMFSRKHDPRLWSQGLFILKRGDKYRREDFSKSFPEFFELIEKWWNEDQ